MLDVKKLQAIRDKVLGVVVNPAKYGDLNSVVYLEQILDALLGTNALRVRGNLAEHVYLQKIRNAILGLADGQFGSLSNSIYLQQIVNAFNGVTSTKYGSLSENSYLDAAVTAARPVSVPWYNLGGASAVGAYAAKGAASQAASYINLANPGVNLTPVGSPTWNAVDGIILNGTTQYLKTGLLGPSSVIIRVTNPVNWLFGYNATEGYYFACLTYQWQVGAVFKPAPAVAVAGVYCLTLSKSYINGAVDQTGFGGVPLTYGAMDLWIGQENNYGAPGLGYGAMKMQALAVYNAILTDAQVASISAAMAVL